MKAKKIIVLMLALVLVCAILVACNDDNGNKTDPVERPAEQPVERKPTVDPNPNNPYDVKNNDTDYSKGDWNFDGTAIIIDFTNAESLNNLFYDFQASDFGSDRYKSVRDRYPSELKDIRQKISSDSSDETVTKYNRSIRLELTTPSKEKVLEYIEELRKDKGIRYAGPELYGSWFLTTNDTEINQEQQKVFDRIKLNDAWDITTGSSSITVGLVDSGINKTHEDLIGNISNISCGTDPYLDQVQHGTLTAGIIGAVGNNGKGTSGVCWNVKIASLKACVGAEHETIDLVIEAIKCAKENNIKLLNYSGGFYQNEINNDSELIRFKQAIDDYPGLIVVAAGNAGANIDSTKTYPHEFDCDNMIVVGATTTSDARASYSNYSATKVDLFAPGYAYTTNNNGRYIGLSATSLAAPYVTGVAALLLSKYPNLCAGELKCFIMQNVDQIASLSGKCVSGGRVNAKKALANAHTHHHFNSTYQNLGVKRGHIAICNLCGFEKSCLHNWMEVKKPNTGIVTGYECFNCHAKSQLVAIPEPFSLLAPNVLALINEKESVTSGDFDIEITKDVAIVKKDGKYYLMIACDDNGNPIADLSRVIRKDEVI